MVKFQIKIIAVVVAARYICTADLFFINNSHLSHNTGINMCVYATL